MLLLPAGSQCPISFKKKKKKKEKEEEEEKAEKEKKVVGLDPWFLSRGK